MGSIRNKSLFANWTNFRRVAPIWCWNFYLFSNFSPVVVFDYKQVTTHSPNTPPSLTLFYPVENTSAHITQTSFYLYQINISPFSGDSFQYFSHSRSKLIFRIYFVKGDILSVIFMVSGWRWASAVPSGVRQPGEYFLYSHDHKY